MAIQMDELHKGLPKEVVCPAEWLFVLLQVRMTNSTL